MRKILVYVPKNTLPYRCGERLMVCEMEGKSIKRCTEFFKDPEEARAYARENGIQDCTRTWIVRAV